MKNAQINRINKARQQSKTLLMDGINKINNHKSIVDALCRHENTDGIKENSSKSTKSTNKSPCFVFRELENIRQFGISPNIL